MKRLYDLKNIFYFLVFITLSTTICYCQPCSDVFIEQISNKFEAKKEKQKQIVKKCLKNESVAEKNFDFIYIPKINYKKNLNKSDTATNNFFCYLDVNKIYFDQTIIVSESELIGNVSISCSDASKMEFDKLSPYFNQTIQPFFDIIKDIQPEYIFQVYQATEEMFWCIKNRKMYAIYKESFGYKVISAEEYLSKASIPIFYMEPVMATGKNYYRLRSL